jgi:hypothetical protein
MGAYITLKYTRCSYGLHAVTLTGSKECTDISNARNSCKYLHDKVQEFSFSALFCGNRLLDCKEVTILLVINLKTVSEFCIFKYKKAKLTGLNTIERRKREPPLHSRTHRVFLRFNPCIKSIKIDYFGLIRFKLYGLHPVVYSIVT